MSAKRGRMLLLLLAGFFGVPAWATTVILLYTPDAVYIAADSKVGSLDGAITGQGCKVHVSKNYVWAAAGLFSESNGPFDLEKIVSKSLEGGQAPGPDADRLESDLGAAFRDVAARAIPQAGGSGKVRIEIALASVKKVGRVSSIFLNMETVQRRDCPGKECGGLGVITLGEHGTVDRILDARHSIWKEMGIAGALNYLLAEQAKSTPLYVSAPFAIVRVDRAGAQWLQKGSCH
ncbi:MAG: hypothetical protein P4K83_12115 [Terracidiphilus sp.]|nr:hypothetical protein [Terracidiphilus sp.]